LPMVGTIGVAHDANSGKTRAYDVSEDGPRVA
jgi:hypothetical protein